MAQLLPVPQQPVGMVRHLECEADLDEGTQPLVQWPLVGKLPEEGPPVALRWAQQHQEPQHQEPQHQVGLLLVG